MRFGNDHVLQRARQQVAEVRRPRAAPRWRGTARGCGTCAAGAASGPGTGCPNRSAPPAPPPSRRRTAGSRSGSTVMVWPSDQAAHRARDHLDGPARERRRGDQPVPGGICCARYGLTGQMHYPSVRHRSDSTVTDVGRPSGCPLPIAGLTRRNPVPVHPGIRNSPWGPTSWPPDAAHGQATVSAAPVARTSQNAG